MSNLTQEQARSLARALRKLSSELADYRFENWDQLTEEQRSRIEGMEWTLLNYSSDMTATAVEIATDNLAQPLAQIEAATQTLEQAMVNIQSVSRVINIASKTLTFAASVASGNVSAIKDSAEHLIGEFTEDD